MCNVTFGDGMLFAYVMMTLSSSGFLLVMSIGKCLSSFQPDRFILLSLALSETLLAPVCFTLRVKNWDVPRCLQDNPCMMLVTYVIFIQNAIYCIGLIELAAELALRNKLKCLVRSRNIRWIVSLVAGSFPWIVVSFLMAPMALRGVGTDTRQNDQSITDRNSRIVLFNLVPRVLSILACTMVQWIRPKTYGLKKQPTDGSIHVYFIANAQDTDLISDLPAETLRPAINGFSFIISQGVQPAGQLSANDSAVVNLRASIADSDKNTKDTPTNRQQDIKFNRKQDTQPNRQRDTQPNRRRDTQTNCQHVCKFNRKQDTQPNRQQVCKFNRKQDTQPNRQQVTKFNRKQDNQPNRQQVTKFNLKQVTQPNRKQCELISICAAAEIVRVKLDQNDKQRLEETSSRNLQMTPTEFTEKTQKSVLLYSAIASFALLLPYSCWLFLDVPPTSCTRHSVITVYENILFDGFGIFAVKCVLFAVMIMRALVTPFVMSFWYI